MSAWVKTPQKCTQKGPFHLSSYMSQNFNIKLGILVQIQVLSVESFQATEAKSQSHKAIAVVDETDCRVAFSVTVAQSGLNSSQAARNSNS
jgi:hypothetical protein